MSEWLPERIEQLRALWADPSLSCAEIGRRLGGLSASAITGKRQRLGLPSRGSPLHPPGAARPHQYPRVRVYAVALPKLGPMSADTQPRQLPSGTCQFIAGDVRHRGWCFCDEPVVEIGSPWCAKHRRAVYQPRSAMRAEVE